MHQGSSISSFCPCPGRHRFVLALPSAAAPRGPGTCNAARDPILSSFMGCGRNRLRCEALDRNTALPVEGSPLPRLCGDCQAELQSRAANDAADPRRLTSELAVRCYRRCGASCSASCGVSNKSKISSGLLVLVHLRADTLRRTHSRQSSPSERRRVAGIHAFNLASKIDVDSRDTSGYDAVSDRTET
jgi:hypothetical protein